jgi:hypothetical protein
MLYQHQHKEWFAFWAWRFWSMSLVYHQLDELDGWADDFKGPHIKRV